MWILPFVVVGFLATFILQAIVIHFAGRGPWIALGLVVVGPIALFVGVLALPELLRKLRTIKPRLHWWHALWFLLYMSTLVWRVRDQGAVQQQPLDAWAMLRIIPEFYIFLWLTIRFLKRETLVRWAKVLFQGIPRWLTIYALVCIASTLWSVFPAWTLFKSLEYMLDVIVLVTILSHITGLEDYESLFRWTWALFGVELLWVWIQIPLWPGDSIEDGRLKGVIPATAYNYVGQSGAFMAVLALCRLFPVRGHRRDHVPFAVMLFAFASITLVLSQTRNAILGFAFAVSVILILTKRKWLLMLGGLVGALAWFLTPLGEVAMTYLQREQSSDAVDSLTGRMEMWSYAWQEFLKQPVRGMGAYAAGRFLIMYKLGLDRATLHSDWVEVMVGVGLAGLIPFILALLCTWWYLLRSANDPTLSAAHRQTVLEAVGVLGVITVHSFFNDELAWHAPLLLLVILGWAELLRRRRKQTATVRVPVRLVSMNPIRPPVYSGD